VYFIANPAAGRGRGRKALDALRSLLEPEDTLVVSQGPGDCERLAAEATAAGRPALTVVGGDGTLGEVVNGIASSGSGASLGVLPVGTANDFAIYLGIPNDLERALAIVRAGHTRRVDLGIIVRGDRRRYFATTIGAGLNAIIAGLSQGETDKAVGSPITYMRTLTRELFRYRPIEVELAAEGVSFRGPVLMTSISNGEQEGGIFKLAPGARVDDGFLHLLIIEGMPAWLRPWYILHSVWRGTSRTARAQLHPVKAATLRTVEHTPFYVDGELDPLPAGETVEISLEEKALSAIAPQPEGRP
jgi:diacylglycerol kinase (ATP)